MNNEKMGQFISQLRKSKQMTQKDLAAKLNITDKAVSKWERGLSCPDISLLPSLADILDVTVNELLNGEISSAPLKEESVTVDNAIEYADKTAKSRVRSSQSLGAALFSFFLIIGIVVCGICDVAITGAFTWSLIPVTSVIFTWIVFFPLVKWGAKKTWASLAALSVAVLPFLYVLGMLIPEGTLILSIGVPTSLISLGLVWIIFGLFQWLKTKKLIAAALSLFLSVPYYILINYTLSKIIDEPIMDVWDVVSMAILVLIGIILLLIYSVKPKK
jgi:transcriptional regulator with XRE-family HTH domain